MHRTPLTAAARTGRAKVVRYLLDHGADVNAPQGRKRNGLSPLMLAALSGKLDVVRMLLDAGADLKYAYRPTKNGPAVDVFALAREEKKAAVLKLLRART